MNDLAETPRQAVARVAADLGLSIAADFVPWSRSRNKREKYPSLNWCVTVLRNGRQVLTTDYMAGSAHCPSYKSDDRRAIRADLIKWECENGRRGKLWQDDAQITRAPGSTTLQPDLCDVLHSLALDSDVLDAAGFESWAGDLGYDADSRAAEAIYRACLDIALKLRSALGDDGLRRLREACHDY